MFVYVKDGLGDIEVPGSHHAGGAGSEGLQLRAATCSASRSGQPLDIVNSDETLHNIHALPMTNREFNRGQALKGLKHSTSSRRPK